MRATAQLLPVLTSLLLVACASPQPAPPPVPAAPSTAAPSRAPARSASTARPAAGTADAGGVDPALIKRGFRARHRNGQVKYCRTQVLTGTHFSNTVCYSAEEIRVQDANTKADMDLVNRQGHSPCPNNKCD